MPAPTAVLPTSTHCFTGWSVPKLLELQAKKFAGKTLLIWEDEMESHTWTYQQFWLETLQTAAGLQASGVEKNDRVLLHMVNSPWFLIAYFACHCLGATAVTTNTRSSEAEVRYFVEKSGAKGALVDGSTAPTVSLVRDALDWIITMGPYTSVGEAEKTARLDQLPVCSPLENLPSIEPLTAAGIQFTSGTNSRPKGVVFTHANVLWAGRVGASHLDLSESDKTLIIAPLYHVNALFYSAMASVWSGGTVVLVPKFSRQRFWDTVKKYEITWMSIQPFAIRVLSNEVGPENKMKFLGLGAASLSEFEGPMHTPTLGWWGMTETVTHAIHSQPGWPSRRMSMGRPSPEYEVKVVDESGEEVVPSPDGARGRLLIRGVVGISLFWEYLEDEEATAQEFDSDGWFQTGDIVVVFDDGEILFGDREKDMIRVGGENVAASEIERVISAVPGVKEVAVIAKPDLLLDEVPYAFITSDDPRDVCQRVLKECRSQLADFKVPKSIKLISEFPRSELDKIAKSKLRALVVEPR